MANTVYRHVKGIEGISAILQGLPKEMRTNFLGAAVDNGAKPVEVLAKRFARRSRDTGALEESIDHVVRKYPHTVTAVAVIGPAKSYYRGRRKLAKGEDRQGAAQPSRRAHLIEFGHHTRQPKKTGKSKPGKIEWVPPQPFMRPAHMISGPQVLTAMQQSLGNSIERTRRRLIKQGIHVA